MNASSAYVQRGDPEPADGLRRIGKNLALIGLSLALGLLTYLMMPADMAEAPRRMATIFAVSLVLWVSEAIPLFATSLVVIALQAWWIAVPEGIAPDWPYQDVFAAFADPVVFLFLGGFILARAVQQERIDTQMAGLLLRFFGRRPYAVLAGVMLVTAFFSMWMSNTATTAMMIVLVQPFMKKLEEGDRFRRALILSVPFAANIGGIGTPIGTPPNAIALAQLNQRGLGVTFFEWMAFAMPLLIGALVVMWIVLLAVYRPRQARVDVELGDHFVLTRKAAIVYGTFVATVLLWLTNSFHGVPNAVVAIVPAAVLTVTGVISKDDFNRLEWNILMLIAGGIALGGGITQTGLDDWIVRLMPGDGMPFLMLVAVVGLAAVALSTVISNTVATNILLPIGLALAVGIGAGDQQLQVLAIICAILSSFAMGLPISTPPNAIAYGSGQISSRDMMLVGGATSVCAAVLLVLTGPFVVAYILGL